MMDKDMKTIMAGVFAMGNIGLDGPNVDKLAMAVKHPPRNAEDAICMLADEYIESDSMLKMFAEEAEMWMELLEKDGEEKSRSTFPEDWELYDQAITQAAQGVK